MGHVSRLLSLAPMMHAVTKPAVTKLRRHGILWPYKSQRKATNQRGKNTKNGGEGQTDEKNREAEKDRRKKQRG